MATTAVKRIKIVTSTTLLRLLAAIKSRNVVAMAARLELHLRRLADGRGFGGIELEELGGVKAEHAGQNVRRKALQARVVLADHVVVMLAGEADAVFRGSQLLLQG